MTATDPVTAGHLLYTEEDVTRAAAKIHDRECEPWCRDSPTTWPPAYFDEARAILDDLAARGRFLPPGGIGRTEWLVIGKRRQQYPCFDEAEARSVAQMTGGRIQTRQTMAWPGGAVYASGWAPWSPVPDTEPEG